MVAILFPYITFDFVWDFCYNQYRIYLECRPHFSRRLFCFQGKRGVSHGIVGLIRQCRRKRGRFFEKDFMYYFISPYFYCHNDGNVICRYYTYGR